MQLVTILLFVTIAIGPSVEAQVTLIPTNSPKLAQNVMMAWDASPDSAVVGYNIYYGTNSGVYAGKLAVSNVLASSVNITPRGVTYYFAASARDINGIESPFSNEISTNIPNLVAQAPLSIYQASPFYYGTTNLLIAVGGSGTGLVTYVVSSGPGYVTSNGSLVVTGVGNVELVATITADDVYLPQVVTNQIVTSKANQAITFAALGAQKTTNVLTLSAVSSSKLPISYSIVSGPGLLVSNLLSFAGVGTVKVAATQSGNSNYVAAVSVTNVIPVTSYLTNPGNFRIIPPK